MKVVIQHETYGEIVYEESVWTGKKSISIGGASLRKIDKKTFAMTDGVGVTVIGNYLTGVKLRIGTTEIRVTPAVKWYEIVLSLLPIILIIVWGNVPSLCGIIPIVGGAIGGAISGVMCVVNLFAIKGLKKIWLKIIVSLAVLAATFGICALIALAILSALT